MLTIPATKEEIAEGEILLEAARRRMAAFLDQQERRQQRGRHKPPPPPPAAPLYLRQRCHRGCLLDS